MRTETLRCTATDTPTFSLKMHPQQSMSVLDLWIFTRFMLSVMCGAEIDDGEQRLLSDILATERLIG
jgi:hypothetical protein